MRCIVTAGPTWEPLDRARRLTNFSTGRLGGELANALLLAGHEVELFLSETALWRQPLAALTLHSFSTTASLASAIESRATPDRVAFFHAAAVSDFQAGARVQRGPDGALVPVQEGKPQTDRGALWVELQPTPKILPRLRAWFPLGTIVGWKYEVDGTREEALGKGRRQLEAARSQACVVNGPAYGDGFALVVPEKPPRELPNREVLFTALLRLLER
jgi:phosphopantothenoylcysteine decarboxylase/phosphopantothenate--cysteine ligase